MISVVVWDCAHIALEIPTPYANKTQLAPTPCFKLEISMHLSNSCNYWWGTFKPLASFPGSKERTLRTRLKYGGHPVTFCYFESTDHVSSLVMSCPSHRCSAQQLKSGICPQHPLSWRHQRELPDIESQVNHHINKALGFRLKNDWLLQQHRSQTMREEKDSDWDSNEPITTQRKYLQSTQAREKLVSKPHPVTSTWLADKVVRDFYAIAKLTIAKTKTTKPSKFTLICSSQCVPSKFVSQRTSSIVGKQISFNLRRLKVQSTDTRQSTVVIKELRIQKDVVQNYGNCLSIPFSHDMNICNVQENKLRILIVLLHFVTTTFGLKMKMFSPEGHMPQ